MRRDIRANATVAVNDAVRSQQKSTTFNATFCNRMSKLSGCVKQRTNTTKHATCTTGPIQIQLARPRPHVKLERMCGQCTNMTTYSMFIVGPTGLQREHAQPNVKLVDNTKP